MKKNEVMIYQKKVLEELKRMNEELGVAVVLRDHEEEKLPTDILTTLFTDMGNNEEELMGEFYFFPVEGEEVNVLYFTSVITITENIPDNSYEDLAKAVERINFFLPNGFFLINPDHNLLVYKCTYVLNPEDSIEHCLNMVNINVGVSMDITVRWMDVFLGMEKGEISYKDFLTLMP